MKTLRQKQTIVRRFMKGTETADGIAFELITRKRPWNDHTDSEHEICDILRDYMNGKFTLERKWRAEGAGKMSGRLD